LLYRRLFLVTLTLSCGCKQENSAPVADAAEQAEILDLAADVTAVDAAADVSEAADATAVDAADAASDTSAVGG
jgi:hypothetical protein